MRKIIKILCISFLIFSINTNTSYTQLIGPKIPKIKWKNNFWEIIGNPKNVVYFVTPSLSIGKDGTIYLSILSSLAEFYAINPDDGTLKWRSNDFLSKKIEILSEKVVISQDGTMYANSMDGKFYAINPDGTFKWVLNLKTSNPPVIGQDGTIYQTDANFLYAIDSFGIVKWKFKISDLDKYYENKVAIARDGTLYVNSAIEKNRRTLYAIDSNGNLKWKYEFSGDWFSGNFPPVIGEDGSIYIAVEEKKRKKWIFGRLSTPTEYLVSINPEGNVKWKLKVDCIYLDSIPPSIDKKGNIYFLDCGGKLYSLDSNGNLRWVNKDIIEEGSDVFLPLLIDDDNNIYFVSVHNGVLISINNKGEINWRMKLTSRKYDTTCGMPVIGENGDIYIFCEPYLIAIGEENK